MSPNEIHECKDVNGAPCPYWFGIDVGGANIKAFNSAPSKLNPHGSATNIPFPMWRQHERLDSLLRDLFETLPKNQPIAATMTGELADCFESKREGVDYIVSSLTTAAQGRTLLFFSTTNEFWTNEEAQDQPIKLAASNWLASASLAIEYSPDQSGFFVDIGSTTTDIIPFCAGRVETDLVGQTDLQRLQNQTLVYIGVSRTPVCGVMDHLSTETNQLSLANELFATVRDAYLVLGEEEETEGEKEALADFDTADGRQASFACAKRRLARMLCSDVGEVEAVQADLLNLFAQAIDSQVREKIGKAIQHVVGQHPDIPKQFVLAGLGEWKAFQIVSEHFPGSTIQRFSEKLTPEQSTTACAVAVARLANQRMKRSPTVVR